MDFRIIKTERFEVVGRVSLEEAVAIVETLDPELKEATTPIAVDYNAATGKSEIAYEKRVWLTVEQSPPQSPYPKEE